MAAGRVVVAAFAGGTMMFVWGAVAHMALPIGEAGIQSLPNEGSLVPMLKSSIHERGFYFFPGMNKSDTSEQAVKNWEDKIRSGPRGIVIYDPSGGEPMSAGQLGTEFGSNVLGALLAAVVLVRVPGGRLTRTLVGMTLGLIAWCSIEVSYWNWYRFPDAYTLATLVEHGVGWLLTGGVIALVLGKSASAATVRAEPM